MGPPSGAMHGGMGFFVHVEPFGNVPSDTLVAGIAVRLALLLPYCIQLISEANSKWFFWKHSSLSGPVFGHNL
jgi:hypothetical protein